MTICCVGRAVQRLRVFVSHRAAGGAKSNVMRDNIASTVQNSRAHAHWKPWLKKKHTTMRGDMKSIISDFTRSARLSELEQQDVNTLRGRPPSPGEPGPNPRLESSDHLLARDIMITDMQSRIDRLKRKIAVEQQQFERETVEVRDKLKDLDDRHVELHTQNCFLREAILTGQLGESVNVNRFEELYNELIKQDKNSEGETDSEIDEDDEIEVVATSETDSAAFGRYSKDLIFVYICLGSCFRLRSYSGLQVFVPGPFSTHTSGIVFFQAVRLV